MKSSWGKSPLPGDLLAWRDARLEHAELHCWRTATGEEVVRVIESGNQVVPIGFKARARPDLADCATPDVPAVPWWRLL
jgi:hypothetical protein